VKELEWLLGQVFSYLRRFYLACWRPDELLRPPREESELELADALLFFALSLGIATLGFDQLFAQTPDDRELTALAIRPILAAIVSAIGLFIGWNANGARLPFRQCLMSALYIAGSLATLQYLASRVLLGCAGLLSPRHYFHEMQLGVWSAFVAPTEMVRSDFPENWIDGFVLVVLLLIPAWIYGLWWKSIRRHTGIARRPAVRAFLAFLACAAIAGATLLNSSL
jgi:hypothetical protein